MKKYPIPADLLPTSIEPNQPNNAPQRGDKPTYVTNNGIPVHVINGKPMFHADDVYEAMERAAQKLPEQVAPQVKAAEDARKIIHELLGGIGEEMEQFRENTKKHIEEIRQVRFALVTETSQMLSSLKDLRQFFVGPDHGTEVARLKEFIGLCERLQELKASGFLDAVSDTLLKLA